MAIEIVDLPSYKMVIFHSYVSLPEGIERGNRKYPPLSFMIFPARITSMAIGFPVQKRLMTPVAMTPIILSQYQARNYNRT
jgi:hypothetical protein